MPLTKHWNLENNVIYIFREDCKNGNVKIGYVKKDTDEAVESRRKKLSIGNSNKLILLGTTDGYRKEEGRLHSRFKNSHIGGEWFEYSTEIEEWVHEINGTRNWSGLANFALTVLVSLVFTLAAIRYLDIWDFMTLFE